MCCVGTFFCDELGNRSEEPYRVYEYMTIDLDGVWRSWAVAPRKIVNELSTVKLCFVGRASRYIRVMKTNLMHYLSSVYFVNQPVHVSGIFVAHHQEVHCTYTTIGKCCVFQFTVCSHNTYQLYIYSIPPDDGLQICPKHVEVDWRNKLRINSTSSWFSWHGLSTVISLTSYDLYIKWNFQIFSQYPQKNVIRFLKKIQPFSSTSFLTLYSYCQHNTNLQLLDQNKQKLHYTKLTI